MYDGHYTRHLGNDGGVVLEWKGKVTVIAAVTSAIDDHADVMAKLGERFLYYRFPVMEASEQEAVAGIAIDNCECEQAEQVQLADLVEDFFRGLPIPPSMPATTDAERNILKALSTFAARARSGVARTGYLREIETVHNPESPARLVQQLTRLMAGLKVIGVNPPYRYRLVRKVAMDCVPPTRARVLESLANAGKPLPMATIARSPELSPTMKRRALQELLTLPEGTEPL